MRAHLFDRLGYGAHYFHFTFALVLGLAKPVVAQSYLPKLGGPGGGSFEETCPPGTNLQGFLLGTADDVDSIQIYCIYPIDAGKSSRGGTALPSIIDALIKPGSVLRNQNVLVGKSHGGLRGTPRDLVCPWERPVLLGILVEKKGAETVVVNSIALFCGQALASQVVPDLPNAIFEGPRYNPSEPLIGPTGLWSTPYAQIQNCPAGQVAIGLHGRSGLWVDAIGLICGAPRLAAAAPPNVVGSIGKRPTTGPSQPRSGSICDSARDARARNSPAAPNLEAQFAAYLAAHPPENDAPPAENPPAGPPPDADPPGN